MNATNYASPKIRADDYEAIQGVPSQLDYPVNTIDVVTAMRLNWESTPRKKQMEALKRASQRRPRRGRPSLASQV